jgi:hypothetical protein
MEYTPYARQLTGKNPRREAEIRAFFETMIAKIDLKKVLLEMLRDKHGMIL